MSQNAKHNKNNHFCDINRTSPDVKSLVMIVATPGRFQAHGSVVGGREHGSFSTGGDSKEDEDEDDGETW